MNATSSDSDRLLELLAERALFGLSAEDEAALEALSAQHPEIGLDSMDQLAAMLELSQLTSAETNMPAELKDKIRQTMPTGGKPVRSTATVNRGDWLRQVATWSGWAMAAVLLVALIRMAPQPPPVAVELAPAESRARLVAAANDVLQVAWTATEDATALGASGDVVWSNAAQEGYMRFAGLAANNPTEYQYQLWIFDAEQDEKYPIDGGVFDIPPGSAEVILPIVAKLDVTQPVMFAITIEKPGGVVVSSRERIPLLAKLDS